MSTYKAGLLNVGTLNATGGSALLQANTANVTTLNATTVNAQTLNVPSQSSTFVLPIEQRNIVKSGGKTLENTNYQPAVDATGSLIPFFNPTTVGPPGYSSVKLPEYGAFSITEPTTPSIPGTSQTFQGVCDKEYVYYTWQFDPVGQLNNWTGVNLTSWLTVFGNSSDWPAFLTALIKQDRETGKIVQVQNIGLMMDNAYLAAGSTKAAQELAVGPGVYYQDASGVIQKDSSGNYLTKAVTGNDRTAPGYYGFQTKNRGETWAEAGDDQCRGPLALEYDNALGEYVLYMTTMAVKYSSVYKVRCSDLSLVWRRTIDPLYEKYFNAEATTSANMMRCLIVVPPGHGRVNPYVVAGCTDNFSYSTTDAVDMIKLFNYFPEGGALHAWEDFGATASVDPEWRTLIGPNTIDTSGALPLGIFRWAPPGSNFLTVNGVTDRTDLSGYLLDESGNVSIEVYAPLVQGYAFDNGDPSLTTKAGCKTSGKQALLTGRRFLSFTSQLGGYLTNYVLPGVNVLPYEIELAEFTFLGGTTFDASTNYTGTVLNGPYVGQSVTRTGYDMLCGVPDGSGKNFLQQGDFLFQPVVKKIYKAQVGRALDKYEASEVSPIGGGTWTELAYDTESDVVMTAGGNYVSQPVFYDRLTNMALLGDVSCNGVNYPSVNQSYQVRDSSLNLIYNSWTDISGNVQVRDTFHGVGRRYFKGLDLSNNFVAYRPYPIDFYQNPNIANSDYAKVGIQNYYMNAHSDLTCHADVSGFPLNNLVRGEQMWTPGGDVSGNVTTTRQNIFKASRETAYWEKRIAIRDNLHLGPFYNRMGSTGYTGIRVGDGELMFSMNVNGYDNADHSFSEYDWNGGHVPLGLFRGGGFNSDAMSIVVVNPKDASGNRAFIDVSGNGRKLLACATKHRMLLFDYDKLVDPSSNVSLTITNVPDSSGDKFYTKGIQTNTWKTALVHEDVRGSITLPGSFTAQGTDGTNFLWMRSGYVSGVTGLGSVVSGGDVLGKEVHGFNVDAATIYPGSYVQPILYPNPALASFGQTVYLSDEILGALLTPGSPFYNFDGGVAAGITQYFGSYSGEVSPKLYSYNMKTIVNNSIENPSLNKELENIVNWQFNVPTMRGTGTANQGFTIFGSTVLFGSAGGDVYCVNLANGVPLNIKTPGAGEFVPVDTPPLFFNPEGHKIHPFIVDGIIYGYGGNNKWNSGGGVGNPTLIRKPTKVFMWTPYGK